MNSELKTIQTELNKAEENSNFETSGPHTLEAFKNHLKGKNELNEIYDFLISYCEEFDVCEYILEESIDRLFENVETYKEELLFILKKLISKACTQSDYYPYLLTNVLDFSIVVKKNPSIAYQTIQALIPLLESEFYFNNLYALRIGNICLNGMTNSNAQSFIELAQTKLKASNWELRQQSYFVLKSHDALPENFKRSFLDKLRSIKFHFNRRIKNLDLTFSYQHGNKHF